MGTGTYWNSVSTGVSLTCLRSLHFLGLDTAVASVLIEQGQINHIKQRKIKLTP